jgi:hypothetical protein
MPNRNSIAITPRSKTRTPVVVRLNKGLKESRLLKKGSILKDFWESVPRKGYLEVVDSFL